MTERRNSAGEFLVSPKRIIDGEGVWNSEKLAHVMPPSFRPEYACLLPLAMANGSFECNPRLVWKQVYSYNRPDVSVRKVEQMLAEFERVGMLFRWTDDRGKQWGYWIGIDKPGRLPPPSRIEHSHEVLGAAPPLERLRQFIHIKPMASHDVANGSEGLGSGLGLGLGLGINASLQEAFAQNDEPRESAALTLPLHDKTEFPIYPSQIAHWAELFPAIDVPQQLRDMRAWCEANPTRRKHKTGVLRFVTRWLIEQQNRGHRDSNNGNRARKPDAFDIIRASRRGPDFGSCDVPADEPVAHRADKGRGQT